jgi:hypothetical protein
MKLSKITAFCLVSFTLTNISFADSYMAIIGGGGDPAGDKTMFDNPMKSFADNLAKSSKWKYDISFNGGHAQTEELIRSKYNKASTSNNFTPANYKSMIDNYRAKILLGDIKSGDQLVFMINSHGAINSGEGNQTSHYIAASGSAAGNLNNLSGTTLVNLDDLKELVKLANDNGVTMGIIDLSCHSGSTINLKLPNTCVVTATSPKHYAFQGGQAAFSDRFIKELTPGKTLEQAFLEARKDSDDAAYPMISTAEHESIARDVFQSITPYLYYYDPKADKLTDYLIETGKNDQAICKREIQFKDLVSKIEQFKRLVPNSNYAQELKNQLEQYKKTQDDIISNVNSLGGQYLDKIEEFTTTVPGSPRPIKNPLSWKSILKEDPDKWIKYFTEKGEKEKVAKEKTYYASLVENYRKIKNKKLEIEMKYPYIKDFEKKSKEITQKLTQNRETAEKIAGLEKKFYDDLYRSRQGLNFNDPCRKLTF